MPHSPRGYGVYVADAHGAAFDDYNMAMLIPLASIGAGNVFGWTPVSGAGGPVSSRDIRFKPRHVVGVDGTGHRAKAIVADITADLWTGAALTWTDTLGNAYAVTGYVGEKRTATR